MKAAGVFGTCLSPHLRRWQQYSIVGVLLVALAIAAVELLDHEPRRTGTNAVPPASFVGTVEPDTGPVCVHGLSIPEGTAGLRTMFGTFNLPGPETTLTITDPAGGFVRRSRINGYSDGSSPIFRFAVLPKRISGAKACYSVNSAKLAFAGSPNGNLDPESSFTIGQRPANGDVSLEFMAAGQPSVLSMIDEIASRAAMFRPSWVGSWMLYLVFVAALGALAGGIALLIRLGRGVGWGRGSTIALVAIVFVNAAAWAMLTPAFNVPDELAHYTYVETLAHGQLPEKSQPPGERGNSYLPSTVLAAEYTAIGILQERFVPQPWEPRVERRYENEYRSLVDGDNEAYGLTPAKDYSPLYYAPAALVYNAVGGNGVFGKLLAVRLYSALLMAFAAIFVMLFARELLPSVGWFAPVAGLAVAFEPMFLHIGGGASNDSMLVLLSTATLYLLAKMLRRGATVGLAAAVGATFALGYAAKPTIAGLAPAVALTFVAALLRDRGQWLQSLRQLAAGLGSFLLLFGSGAALFGAGSATATSLAGAGVQQTASINGLASYVWQWYLPPMPWMHDFFVGTPPVISVFLRGFVADFNALDTVFANWVYDLIALVGLALAAGACLVVYRYRDSLRNRWPLVAMPATAVAGTALFINVTAYLVLVRDGGSFAQGRYMFPVIGVFGAIVAAGSLGVGRRHGLIVASACVVALGVLNIFGMGLSVARFYL